MQVAGQERRNLGIGGGLQKPTLQEWEADERCPLAGLWMASHTRLTWDGSKDWEYVGTQKIDTICPYPLEEVDTICT